MTGGPDKPDPVDGRHEFLGRPAEEKRVAAGVEGDAIEHQTLPTGEPEELEARRRKLAEQLIRERQASTPATAAPRDTRRNQGSVIAVVVVIGVALLIVAGFAIVMWRVGKSETRVREFLVNFTDR